MGGLLFVSMLSLRYFIKNLPKAFLREI